MNTFEFVMMRTSEFFALTKYSNRDKENICFNQMQLLRHDKHMNVLLHQDLHHVTITCVTICIFIRNTDNNLLPSFSFCSFHMIIVYQSVKCLMYISINCVFIHGTKMNILNKFSLMWCKNSHCRNTMLKEEFVNYQNLAEIILLDNFKTGLNFLQLD